jgi:hypothetical protein
MNVLIYQHFSRGKRINDTKNGPIYEKCLATVERYADNIGCEYQCTSKNYFPNWDPHWDLFRIFEDDRYLTYDKILFVDADVFVVDTDDARIFTNYDQFVAQKIMYNNRTKRRPEYFQYGPNFFNSGIVLFDRDTILAFKNKGTSQYRQRFKKVIPGRDQLALNILAKDVLGMEGSSKRFDLEDACFLCDVDKLTNPLLVHLAGRQRTEYLKDQQRWDEYFNVST